MNPHLLLLLTAILWSSGGLLIKIISWPGPLVAGLRSLVAALCLIRYKKQFKGTRREWLCAISYALCLSTFVMATKLGPAANAIILQYSGPVYAAILGWLMLGDRINKLDYLMLPLALGGTALCFFDSLGSGSLYGNFFGIISGFLFGLMAVLLRSLPENSQGCIFMGNVLATLVALPVIGSLDLAPANLIGIGALGIFQIALPYILFSMALKQVSAVEATMFTLIEPVLNPIWVEMVLGEIPSFLTMLGGVIVLGVLAVRTIQLKTSTEEFVTKVVRPN